MDISVRFADIMQAVRKANLAGAKNFKITLSPPKKKWEDAIS